MPRSSQAPSGARGAFFLPTLFAGAADSELDERAALLDSPTSAHRESAATVIASNYRRHRRDAAEADRLAALDADVKNKASLLDLVT